MENKIKTPKKTFVRIRTLVITTSIIVGLAFYFFVSPSWNEVNLIDLLFVATLSYVVHCVYFPDGFMFGQQNEVFKQNKKAYNDKATLINRTRRANDLKDFCKAEFEKRKLEYIEEHCGKIGITLKEYYELKKLSPQEIKNLEKFEFDGQIYFFTKADRKALSRLLFKPLPVEPNDPKTILSAVENNREEPIRDRSLSYKKSEYIKKFIFAFIIATFLAYVGYGAKDGVTFADVVKVLSYLISITTSAVMSFTKGETCSKVHKNQFYVDLDLYIAEFFEWLLREKNIDIYNNEISTEKATE